MHWNVRDTTRPGMSDVATAYGHRTVLSQCWLLEFYCVSGGLRGDLVLEGRVICALDQLIHIRESAVLFRSRSLEISIGLALAVAEPQRGL